MSTDVRLSECCISGKLHEGKPAGREDELGGLSVYISEPKGGSKAKSVVFITDSMNQSVSEWRTDVESTLQFLDGRHQMSDC